MTAARTSASASTAPVGTAPLGLRERKKLKTRIAIREATYRLIDEQGYDATTIEQIAQGADVSPSTVFRYFPTKEDIVLSDEYDALMEQLLRERPAGEPVVESLRHVLHHAVGQIQAGGEAEQRELLVRARLMIHSVPVRSRLMESMSLTGRIVCRAIGERTGRDPDDFEVRTLAMGMMGALLEAIMYWAERDCRDDLTDLVDRALDIFERRA
ncbi:transcriptional regulator BetI [Streptomyces sp. YIM 130001]|uniref:TetR/AcrR family transcriptional regulator n=1 Tax=Streptomyces sp. YIM 130001 TaxID=2259644 RepID=UPI000E650B2E|nr:TetR family transcriptional regulator [Streptomyces sp. YIM 130001]RII20965.1 transcriptional regulator BetI [Streptomyces sp. YIM 130001]